MKASKLMEESTKLECDKYEPSTWDEFMKTTYHIISETQTHREAVVHITSDMMQEEFSFSISIDVLKDFMKMKYVDVSILQYWIWVLCDRFELQGKNAYRFLDPSKISCKEQISTGLIEFNNNRIRYCEMLNEDGGSVSSPVEHFDDEDDMTAEEQLNRSTKNGRPEETSEASELQTCPIQDGEFEGGYFVMKMMYDIMVRPALQGIDEIYSNGASPFLKKEINEMRSLFCAHFNSKYDQLTTYGQK
ncbi:unnamed protein product [Cuscuta campestris]|uniref:Uncharacterized protein n=1 Tax=Cuscuta campestris TaxID=132261 RepID=A0A484LJT7_9ASTE|nr:unnamed protein product [Cuscuta campestris]